MWLSVLAVVFVAGGLTVYFVSRDHGEMPLVSGVQDSAVGTEIARYKGVPAYQNGNKVTKNHGKHYAKNGYYYGQKWQ